ncbi:MAG: putative membrane protein [Rhodothermales bacterium]|jgi:uncharacterized membrane protein
MITEPTALFALLAGVLGLIFWLSTLPQLKTLFKYLPPIIWAYTVPMVLTTAGITPASNAAYSWMTAYLLPLALFLLMVTVDVRAIFRLGKVALTMMVAGTAGIVIGAPIAYLLFRGFLPEDAWKGFASLSGSWIGGTANMLAIKESVGADDAILGPIIVVDTVVGYGWMGILLFVSAFQERFDRWIGADRSLLEGINAKLLEEDDKRRPITLEDLTKILGLGFVVTVLAVMAGPLLPKVGDPTVISEATWAVLLVVTVGLILSFTPARKLENAGASRIGFLALYLLVASIGARGDLAAVFDAPIYLAAGAVWISIHIVILMIVAKIIKAPLFFVATGSMANVGGAASAPVVAFSYFPALAPVGLLMAVAGYALGIYAALGAAAILGFLSKM